ncbi:MAG: hypothetical protein KDE22_17950, partial [Rhodobacterales bacterium]|nr:hypothetical protein [Rhodobacterales bacterium]
RIPEYRTLLEAGCGWLDRQAVRAGAPSFADLAADRRARLVTAAERTPARALPRVLFLNVLADGRDLYFSHPDVWAGLGYGGPPQPEGFPDQDRPPKPRDAAGARP